MKIVTEGLGVGLRVLERTTRGYSTSGIAAEEPTSSSFHHQTPLQPFVLNHKA